MFKIAGNLMELINQGYSAIQKMHPTNLMGTAFTPNRMGFMPNNFSDYFGRISKVESGGKYDAINNFSGAMGKYQFMPGTLKGLGFNVSKQEFLANPSLQEQAMQKFTQQNAQIATAKGFNINTQDGINAWEGKILAGMHYAGPGFLKKMNNPNYMTRGQAGGHVSIQGYQNRAYN